jgi:hypothetical protein
MAKLFGLTNEQRARVSAGPRRPAMALSILVYAVKQRRGVTADECTQGLGLTHQSGSARFHELVKAGCLQGTGQKRRTRAGGFAVVHVVAPGATFAGYLTSLRVEAKRKGSVKEQALAEALSFLRGWPRASKSKRRILISKLVHRLITLTAAGSGRPQA